MTTSVSSQSSYEPDLDHGKFVRDAAREARKSKIPLFIAALAAFLALISMADSDARKRAMVAHIEASNQFAFFQSKNIRKTDSAIAAEMFESMNQSSHAIRWKAKADQYKKETADILKAARIEQTKRTLAVRQGENFSVAIALLQIAIVLASASIVMGGGMLMSGSVILTTIAVLYTANGYGLYWEVPTDPIVLARWFANISGIYRY